jgi:VCBS repeat-containing protein
MKTYYEVIDAEAEHDAFPTVHKFLTKQHYHEFLEDHEWAYDVEEAARLWAEQVWASHDYADELTASVTEPDGTKHKIRVTVEARPHFHATEIK